MVDITPITVLFAVLLLLLPFLFNALGHLGVGGMKVIRVMFVAMWFLALWTVSTSEALSKKSTTYFWVVESATGVLVGIGLFVIERYLTNEVRKREATIRVIFKDSPLFTKKRKARIKRDLSKFKAYLDELGFDLPPSVLPVAVGGHATGLSVAPMSAQAGRPPHPIYL